MPPSDWLDSDRLPYLSATVSHWLPCCLHCSCLYFTQWILVFRLTSWLSVFQITFSISSHPPACHHIHYFQPPPPLLLFSRDVSLALVSPELPNPDSAFTRQPYLMSLLANHVPSLHPLWLRMGGQALKATLVPHRHGRLVCAETHPSCSSWPFIFSLIQLQGQTNISWPLSVRMACPLRSLRASLCTSRPT